MNAKELLNTPPVIHDDLFSEQNLKDIYAIVEETTTLGESEGDKYKYFFIHQNGMQRLPLPKHDGKGYVGNDARVDVLLQDLRNRISHILGKEIKNLGGYFARYSRESGFFPGLPPHLDEAKFGENYRMSLTSKLKSTVEWDVGVEKNRWSLKDNQVLFFSANLYPHWRPRIVEFSKEDFYDIMVLHFDFVGTTEWPIDQEYFDKKDSMYRDMDLRQWHDHTEQ
jgi:hypothetical protein